MSDKEYSILELRYFLNYDTNTKKVFTYGQRITLHRAISKMIQGYRYSSFDFKLRLKLVDTKKEMKVSSWKFVETRIVEDANGTIITKILN